MGDIRIGRISSVNHASGTARVLYTDRDGAVTQELPLLSGVYEMPKVDDLVVVAHLSNAPTVGVILGTFWNAKNLPAEGKEGVFRKDIDGGKCVIKYDAETGTLTIKADKIILNGEVTNERSGGQ